MNKRQGIDNFFLLLITTDTYSNTDLRLELCIDHVHKHLLGQVNRHRSLSITSWFPRESYITKDVQLCRVQKYILEQHNT